MVDLNGDGSAEFVGSQASDTYVLEITGENLPPTLTNTFRRTWENPVCPNTTINFGASEYDELTIPQSGGTSYYNDFDLDQERIMTSCGLPTADKYSNWSQSTPSIECRYNKTGDYNVVLYLEDSSNIGDRTVIATETVQVNYGERGVTCNAVSGNVPDNILPSPTDSLPSTSVGSGLTKVLDLITGGDEDSKLLIGMVLLIGFVIFIGAKTQSGMAVALGFVGIFVMLVQLTLIPVWILIVFVLILVFVGLMVNATSSAGA